MSGSRLSHLSLAVAVLGMGLWSNGAWAATGNAAAGQQKNAMCVGCHGIANYRTAFPEVYRVPKIAGQHPEYLASALHAYKNGDRSHPSMRAIAASLSDQDILDLAAYYGQPQQGGGK